MDFQTLEEKLSWKDDQMRWMDVADTAGKLLVEIVEMVESGR